MYTRVVRESAYLETIGAAGHGRENVVAVHGAEYEAGAHPASVAVDAVDGRVARETVHADGRQVLDLVVLGLSLKTRGFCQTNTFGREGADDVIEGVTYLSASQRVLSWREEEGPVDQWVAIEHRHLYVTQDAGYLGPVESGQGRQDERSRVVVSVITLVLHLQKNNPLHIINVLIFLYFSHNFGKRDQFENQRFYEFWEALIARRDVNKRQCVV